jgi:hypothetical protein
MMAFSFPAHQGCCSQGEIVLDSFLVLLHIEDRLPDGEEIPQVAVGLFRHHKIKKRIIRDAGLCVEDQEKLL